MEVKLEDEVWSGRDRTSILVKPEKVCVSALYGLSCTWEQWDALVLKMAELREKVKRADAAARDG